MISLHDFIEKRYELVKLKENKKKLSKKEENKIDESVEEFLQDFTCSQNKDVEKYLRSTAMRHHKSSISRTYLIIAEVNDELKIIAYFTLAMKSFIIQDEKKIRDKLLKKMNSKNNLSITFLIGQLGKNDEFSEKINLGEILDFAYGVINEVRKLIGGRLVLIECENEPKLINLYKKYNFELVQTENDLMQLMRLKED